MQFSSSLIQRRERLHFGHSCVLRGVCQEGVIICYAMHMHMHMQCICFEKCEFCFAGRNSVFGDYSEEEEGEEEEEEAGGEGESSYRGGFTGESSLYISGSEYVCYRW